MYYNTSVLLRRVVQVAGLDLRLLTAEREAAALHARYGHEKNSVGGWRSQNYVSVASRIELWLGHADYMNCNVA